MAKSLIQRPNDRLNTQCLSKGNSSPKPYLRKTPSFLRPSGRFKVNHCLKSMDGTLSPGNIDIRPTRHCRECFTVRFCGPPPSERLLFPLMRTKLNKFPAVTVVHDGNFVGVVAPSTEIASRAVKAIRAEWKAEPQPSNKELFEYLKKNATEGKDPTGDASRYEVGSLDKAWASADHRLQQTYTISYIAHAPLEPRAALAQWSGDNLTVWTGTQRPFGVRSELAEAFRIPEEQCSRGDAGYGIGLRGQAHRRRSHRSSATGAGCEAAS